MKQPVFEDNNKEQIEKAKKNLTYLLIFSVFMMFAGLSSAYIVSMGDSFWLKVPLPPAFWTSTGLILASSGTMIAALAMAKNGQGNLHKGLLLITFVLGLGFVYFQFKGYNQLFDNGVHFVNHHIIVTDGRYGDYFEIKKGDDYIEVNGNDYLINGEIMSDQEMKSLQAFMNQFADYDYKKPFKIDSYGDPYTLLFENQPLELKNGKLATKDGKELKLLDKERLFYLAYNVKNGTGDFYVKGEMGKDFHVYYKGKELEYKNRELQIDGAKLSPYLQLKAMESADTASSYLFLISFLHLLHVIITLLFLLLVVIRSFTGVINKENLIQLKTTGIFWHFLGALWVYLLLFLLFIH